MEIIPISHASNGMLSAFDCGVEALDTYLRRFAKKNDKLGVGKTFVLVEEASLLGFYTVSMAQVSFDSLPTPSQAQLPRYPMPAVRIGRLAIDLQQQGRGLGQFLLMDALSRSVRLSEEIAVFSVIVDAKNEKAREFYCKYGFDSLDNERLSLFLPIKTIKQSCELTTQQALL